MKVCYITTVDFSASANGEHVYARLVCGGERTDDLKYPLTEAQAGRLNKKDGFGCGNSFRAYSVGDMTERFEDDEHVIRFVRGMWKERFPDADVLILGSPAYCGAQRIIEAPTAIKDELIKLHEEYKSLYYQKKYCCHMYCKDETRAMEIDDTFYKILHGK